MKVKKRPKLPSFTAPKLVDEDAYPGFEMVKRVTDKLPIGGYIVGLSASVSMVGPKGLVCSVIKTGSYIEDYKALAKELGV